MTIPVQDQFTSYGYVVLSGNETPQQAVTTFPDQWHQKYFQDQLFEVDPIFEFAERNANRTASMLLEEAQMQSELFEEAKCFDANSNFVCASHIAGSSLVFGGVNPDLDDRKVADCQNLVQQTHRLELIKRFEGLTDAQRDVLDMSDEGLLDKQIASELGISLSAVAQRKKAICQQIGTGSYQPTLALYSVAKWGAIVAAC